MVEEKISNGGKIVAIVGIDGSGKTSIVSEMQYFYSRQMNVTRVFFWEMVKVELAGIEN